MDQQQNIDFVLRTVEERDIRFIRLWFTDVLGRLKSFAISPEDLEVAFEEGIGFDGSAIEGFTSPDEADMLAFPDASTFQILPCAPSTTAPRASSAMSARPTASCSLAIRASACAVCSIVRRSSATS